MHQHLQRRAIAEALGFTNISTVCWRGHLNGVEARVPDYLYDLGAMHVAEKALTDVQYADFAGYLYDISCAAAYRTKKWRWLSSTAPQRAEAFLRAVGKWEGES